ncbi:hypothetical protein B0H13DRAFT_2313821 [Mycena leptocephala]|nr:hypothetical protein B0H13DRAFT_2313821 [Mycena leptocephala]
MSSPHLRQSIQDVKLAASITGVALSVSFLAAVAYLQWNSVSRPHLNRVSFRLLVPFLSVVFGVRTLVSMNETSPGCSFAAFLTLTAPFFSAYIFCCVALNLQLVLVYGVNGNKMEKYYLFGAAFLCGVCSIPIWAAGRLGWDAQDRICWVKDPTSKGQLDWLIGTQFVPLLVMSAVEVVSFVNLLIFMLLQVSKIQRLRAHTSESGSAIATLASMNPKHPIVQFRPIIIRIALYPLLSCFLSISMSVLGVYNGVHTDLTNSYTTLRTFIYSFRPLLYVLLAATDPSFLRAVRSVRAQPLSQSTPLQRSERRTATTVSFKWTSKLPVLGKCSQTTSIVQEQSSVGDCERQPSTVEEARAEEELRSNKIAQQL